MNMHRRMNFADGTALHGLSEEASDDIFIRVDHKGFIINASRNMTALGYDLSQWLLKPHLADLAAADQADEVRAHINAVLTDGDTGVGVENAAVEWLEFAIRPSGCAEGASPRTPALLYALSLRAVSDENGAIIGAVGLLRSMERRRAIDGALPSRALVDPLTGLANRHAFCATLRRQLASRHEGAVALFEIDRMRAVFMQYGQRTADEIIWGFAKFLETMVNAEYELAQFDGERFCVILTDLPRKASRRWAEDVLKTFASLTLTTSARGPQLSASAGLAAIEGSVDATLKQAELALVMARARGGMQVAECVTPGLGNARIAL